MESPKLRNAIPVLASLNIADTMDFYQSLNFRVVYQEEGNYGIVQRDNVEIHFWACSDKYIAENTSCRIQVDKIDFLYTEFQDKRVVHPNGLLRKKPWGTKEFSILDRDGNQLTFFEYLNP
jgi:hypothetical protein